MSRSFRGVYLSLTISDRNQGPRSRRVPRAACVSVNAKRPLTGDYTLCEDSEDHSDAGGASVLAGSGGGAAGGIAIGSGAGLGAAFFFGLAFFAIRLAFFFAPFFAVRFFANNHTALLSKSNW